MDEFSPWDIADSFRLHEAACLIAGVMPLSKRVPDREELPAQAIPIYVKLGSAYVLNWVAHHKDMPDDPKHPKAKMLKSIDEVPTLPELQPLKKLTGELVSRAELHRWISAMGIKSAYSFGSVANSLDAEPDTAPAQTLATPAPKLGESASVAVPKQRAQEYRILELLRDNGYNPLKLSKRSPGKPGPKAEIRTLALTLPALFTKISFEKAWERLRNEDALAGAE